VEWGDDEMSKQNRVEDALAQEFTCPRCKQAGAHVEKLAMSGTGLSRLLEIQTYRYAFVSCHNCGYTEVYNLHTLEGKDDLGTILEVLFSN
jgi:predicted nucleic-acid-binding Zn-ribbon protein